MSKNVNVQPSSALEDHIGFWLRFVSNHVSHAFAQRVEGAGVSVSEWVVLRLLHDHRAQTVTELAQATGMTKGAISKQLRSLESAALVARAIDSTDRRSQGLKLTAKGRKLLPKLAAMADANDDYFFGHLCADDRRALMAVMRDLVNHHRWRSMPIC